MEANTNGILTATLEHKPGIPWQEAFVAMAEANAYMELCRHFQSEEKQASPPVPSFYRDHRVCSCCLGARRLGGEPCDHCSGTGVEPEEKLPTGIVGDVNLIDGSEGSELNG